MIHKAKIEPGHYGYNHDVSLEWFDGRFICVWNAFHGSHVEGLGGQVNVMSESKDFSNWSLPVEFLSDPKYCENPIHIPSRGVMWQPNLINYNDRELWCFWCLCDYEQKSAELENSGTYLSILKKGTNKWVNRRIVDRHMIGKRSTIGFPSQNPFICKSGRVLVPVTFIDGSVQNGNERNNCHFNVCMYTDDEGRTWQFSNPVTQIDDKFAQWEPFFYEQQDGRLRAVMRNFTHGTPECNCWQLTCEGTGSEKGEPVVFDPDPRFSRIETANTRCQIFRTSGDRYCMLHHDVFLDNRAGQWQWGPYRDYHSRLNVSLFFSRSGKDDFVAALPVSRRNIVSAYPQGVEHNGKIYAAYTVGRGDECRSVEGVMVDGSPQADRYYIWPRQKDYVKLKVEYKGPAESDQSGPNGEIDYTKPPIRFVTRTNPDEITPHTEIIDCEGRKGLFFTDKISAGVEVPDFSFQNDQSLRFGFEFRMLSLAEKGILVLCSFGDEIPIRLGVPCNRRDMLYAYTRDQWRPAAVLSGDNWEKVSVIFSGKTFIVSLNEEPGKTFDNPILYPNARLYLGDGYESNYLPNNVDSEFVIDINSIESSVLQNR